MNEPSRRRPGPADDPGYEVVESPPAAPKLAVAKRAVPKPPPQPADDEPDEVEDRPRRRKSARWPGWWQRNLAWVLVAGAVGLAGLVAAGLGAAYLLTQERPQPQLGTTGPAAPPSTAAPGPAVAARPTPPGWVRFTAPDGSVTADLPEQPKPVNVPPPRGGEVAVRTWKTDIGGVDYLINMVVPTGSAGPDAGPVDRQLDDLAKGFVSTAGMGQPVGQSACTVAGHPGRQLHFQGPTGSAVFRMTMVGKVTYVFGATCPLPRMPADAKEATDFFDSIRLGPPPAASASPPAAADAQKGIPTLPKGNPLRRGKKG